MLYEKNEIDDTLSNDIKFNEALKIASKTYGEIHKATPASMHNNRGFLIWDFLIHNELTFLNVETGSFISLYHSVLDEKMEIMFREFAEKYGVGIVEQKNSKTEIFKKYYIHMV